MTKGRKWIEWAMVAVLSLTFTLPVAGQSAGPSHSGYDPNASMGTHFHAEGELGEKLMILETALKCDCGCGLDVHSCQFQMQCGTSPAWTVRIREALDRGESVDVIKAGFVADYGTQVLMMPPAEGFNLLGYFLPAVAILMAGSLVGIIVRGGVGTEGLVPAEAVSDQDAERLRAAMAKLDEAESPDW